MAMIKGIEKVVGAEGFDIKVLKEVAKKLNESGVLEKPIRVIKSAKEVLVDSFMRGVESVPEGSELEKKIPSDAIRLYADYVDVIEDRKIAITVPVEMKQEVKTDQGAEVGEEKKPKKEKKEKVKKEKSPKEPKTTKKSVIVDLLNGGGATLDQMGQKMTELGLGDLERNVKTAGLWIKKIGFPVKKQGDGKWVKA